MAESELTVVPIIEEWAAVTKCIVDRGGVRVTKLVHGRDGATVIIPVLEEVIVVEKRLMLKEELRVTMQQTIR